MRGLAAHSNGFQTIRSLAILMSLLGTIDRPGGFRHKAPFPRAIPPSAKSPNSPDAIKPNTPLAGLVLGWPASPDDLFIDDAGGPVRIDKGFSWEYPLSVHGLMHNVITNAWRGDPYRIDTLLIFMANMAWNSTMNTSQIRRMLNDRDDNGDYKIPFLVVCDAFQSEMTAFADLVLPDTTYLERHDVMSMLDRPISEFDGPMDSVRVPVVPPKGECKPFQEVLIELASRLKFPAFTHPDQSRKFKDYPDFILNYETEPGSGIGFLSGWRGKDGTQFLKGEPNPRQWEMYAANNCVYHYRLPRVLSVHAQLEPGLSRVGAAGTDAAIRRADPHPALFRSDADVPAGRPRQAARATAAGALARAHRDLLRPAAVLLRAARSPGVRSGTVSLERGDAASDGDVSLVGLAECVAAPDPHPQLSVRESATARANGVVDDGWLWVESQWGKVRCQARYSEAVEPGTVWTWNAIGKAAGAWHLAADANESRRGFILNHLISEELPAGNGAGRISNADPITGQAAWYDVRVRIYPAAADEPKAVWPQVPGDARGARYEHGEATVAGLFRW